MSNCVITGNQAVDAGGGVAGGKILNSMVYSNQAARGAGVYNAVCQQCSIYARTRRRKWAAVFSHVSHMTVCSPGNSAPAGGGVAGGMFFNCTLTENLAGNSGGGSYNGTLYKLHHLLQHRAQ